MKKIISLLLIFMVTVISFCSLSTVASAITVPQIQNKLESLIEKYPAESYNPTKECYYFVQLLTQELFGHGLPQQPKDTQYKYCFTDSYKENYVQVGKTLTVKDDTLNAESLKNLFSLAQPGDVIQMDYTYDDNDSLHVMMVYSASSEGVVLYHAGAYKLRNGKYSYGKIYLGASAGNDKLYGYSKKPLEYSDFMNYLCSDDDGISLYRSKTVNFSIDVESYTFNTVDDGVASTHSPDYDMTVSIFGRDACVNSDTVIQNVIKSGVDNQKNIRVLFIDCDKKNKEQVKAFKNKYSNSKITFCYDTSDKATSAMLSFAKSAGFGNSITVPMIVFTKKDGTIFKITQGALEADYLYELANGDSSGEELVELKISGEENYTYAFDVLQGLNELRDGLQLNTLVMDKNLMAAAMQRAAELSIYYSHTRPNGESSFTVLNDLNGTHAENIAIGQSGPKTVMISWQNSSGHYKNMTNKDFSSVGIGCFKTSDGYWCWVQLFSSSNSSGTSKSGISMAEHTIKVQKRNLDLGFYTEDNIHNLEKGERTKINAWNCNIGYPYCKQFIDSSLFSYSTSDSSIIKVDDSGYCSITGNGPCTIGIELKKCDCFIPTIDYMVGHIYSNASDRGCDYCGAVRTIEDIGPAFQGNISSSVVSSKTNTSSSKLNTNSADSDIVSTQSNTGVIGKVSSHSVTSSRQTSTNTTSGNTINTQSNISKVDKVSSSSLTASKPDTSTSGTVSNVSPENQSSALDVFSEISTSSSIISSTNEIVSNTSKDNITDSSVCEDIVLFAKSDDVSITGIGNEFSDNTNISIEKIKSGDIVNVVAEALGDTYINYTIYEIVASSQPVSAVTATFNIPKGLNPANVTVLFVSQNGDVDELSCVVDKKNMQVTAKLHHFSTYVVAEKNTFGTFNVLWIIIIIAIVVVIAIGSAFMFVNKRKKLYS